MLETLKTVILDFQEAALFTGVPRRLHLRPVPGKAAVCIGVRRSGKSTYLNQIIRKLLDEGVARENILYLNFFDDRLHNLQQGNLAVILQAYYSLYPEKKNTETVYCFFDEIQTLPDWEPFVDRLMRTEKCEVYLTGSSARMLSREIATQMRGRALSWEMFPFTFREFLDAKNVDWEGPLSSRRQMLVQKAFDEYWETGGFPEVIDLNRNLRIKTHQEYFQTILFRDIVERHDISHPRAASDLVHWLVDNTASLYSVNKLKGLLNELGHKVPKASVSEYLEWFEDAFFLFSVRLYDASFRRSRANPKKVYCIDHSLVTSVSSGILVNSGHLLENLVFTALKRLHPEVYYYRTRTGKEVDFVAATGRRHKTLLQVCETMADPRVRKREVAALSEAMIELKADRGTIVTRNEGGSVEVDGGVIQVTSAWEFLLNLPDEPE